METARVNVQLLDACHTRLHDRQQSLNPAVVREYRGDESFDVRRVFEKAREGVGFVPIQVDRDG